MINRSNGMLNFVFKAYSLLICFSLLGCQNCEDILVSYEEEIPYNVIENQTINLSYGVSETTWNRNPGIELIDIKPRVSAKSIIQNTSDYGGEFTIQFNFKGSNKGEFNISKTHYLQSGESKLFELEDYVAHNEIVDFIDFEIFTPSKTISKMVTKFKTETKYRKCNTCKEDCK